MRLKLTFTRQVLEALWGISDGLHRLACATAHKEGGVKIMQIIKDDQPDFMVQLVPEGVTDAEGKAITDFGRLKFELTSSDEMVLAVSADAGDPANNIAPDPAKFSVHVGDPGQASLIANVKFADKILATGDESFTVTVGDPAAITDVKLNFTGLPEA